MGGGWYVGERSGRARRSGASRSERTLIVVVLLVLFLFFSVVGGGGGSLDSDCGVAFGSKRRSFDVFCLLVHLAFLFSSPL